MPCLKPEQRRLYLEDRLDRVERAALEEHLSTCRDCRRRLVLTHEARSSEATEGPSWPPVEEELKERARAIVRSSRGSAPRRRRGPWAVLAATLVAFLGLLALNGVREPSHPPRDGGETLRAGGAGELRLELLDPPQGSVVDAGALELRWSAVPGAERYTFTLLDGLGNILLRSASPESSLSLDLSALDPPVAAGASCFWYVTAELSDGTALESEVRRLVLAMPPGGRGDPPVLGIEGLGEKAGGRAPPRRRESGGESSGPALRIGWGVV